MRQTPVLSSIQSPVGYDQLLARFGRQGWWPTTPPGQSMPVYWAERRFDDRTELERFEICLGAILTQNTSWTNVVKVLSGLSERGLLSISGVLRQTPSDLESLLRSSGYYRQKAMRVRRFLEFVRNEYGGQFNRMFATPTAELRPKLLALNGIGPETADSMLLYAGGHAVFVVDAYTRRVGERWGLLRGGESYDDVQRIFMSLVPSSAESYAECHALFVELAKRHCQAKPVCLACPVESICQKKFKRAARKTDRRAPRRVS